MSGPGASRQALPGADPQPRPGVAEPLLTFAAATALAAAFFWLARVVPFVRENLHGLIAVVFLYAPAAASRLSGRAFSYGEAGLRLGPVGRGLATLAIALLATWPVFLGAFLAFYGALCAEVGPPLLGWWGELFAPLCGRWRGLPGATLTLPPQLLLLSLSQLLVVALPEELFFRGYLWSRLEARWPARRRLLGAPVGLALPVTSVLFALGHVLVDLDPGRLAVFFPGLVFGWMRARTGTIAAGAAFHALCNLFAETLHLSFFR
jgi:membrane protease YdiL (CAAX protease family)